MKTRLTELLGIDHPIIQAPMAGVSTPALAAAVSNAGGLGSVGFGAYDGRQAREMMRDIKARTNRPYHVNFFAHRAPTQSEAVDKAWLDELSPFFEELGVEPPASLDAGPPSFLDDPDQIDAVLEMKPPVVSFHFGLPHKEQIVRLRESGAKLLASATSVDEAIACERAGMDAVIAQGVEAGGHRGVHDGETDRMIGTIALTPQVVDAVSIPVIAAGGIGDGRGVAAALALGADGAQMGTAFIACPETSAGERHRKILGGPAARETVLTRGVSGRAARGLRSRILDAVTTKQAAAPAYPIAYAATRALSRAALNAGREGFEVMWAGQAGALARNLPAAEVLAAIVKEAEARLRSLNAIAIS
ncbi:MAG: nitronate monooxygenase [Parvularculaceae bacterium]